MNIWIFNSIVCIGPLADILKFREHLYWENEDAKYPLSVNAWIYIPKTIKMSKNNMRELLTCNQFIFLMELKKRCKFSEGCFADKLFSKCTFILRVSCDWDSETSNNFTNIKIWKNNQRIFQRKTLKIDLKDNNIINEYHWLLRCYNEWRHEKWAQNDAYIDHKTIYRCKTHGSFLERKRECIIEKIYKISLKQLWIHYVCNVLCTDSGQNYSVFIVIDIIASFLYEYQLSDDK
eukprot:434481_1